MCGIFGQIANKSVNKNDIDTLVKLSRQRGMDSSGLVFFKDNAYEIKRADFDVLKLLKKVSPLKSNILLGHSRLVTNGFSDNQPVVKDNICAIHNGIIVNDDEVWKKIGLKREQEIDSEIIVAMAKQHVEEKRDILEFPSRLYEMCEGVIACALLVPMLGKILLFSNNGSLYMGENRSGICFASEKFPLTKIGCENIKQIKDAVTYDVPVSMRDFKISDERVQRDDLIPSFEYNESQANMLKYDKPDIKRCTKCILPETMPYISFDKDGVCNYCHNYKLRNVPKPKKELFSLVENYRKKGDELDCIVPFSGGRDSCYGLHLIVNELKMKPITYTYDWGMVTDLGRRNISRMCAKMGVENIIIAADIAKKRRNIALNLKAWLKSPHLGMMAMLTAGDKHFFRHVETIKKQTGIHLNLWGVNPLEVTHFKTGFLGIPPDFEEKRVYSHGIMKQLRYHGKRFKAMTESIGYFNTSLVDTLSGEYFRSFTEKKDYFHIFDYWRWDEEVVDDVLLNIYDWEKAIDTSTTWRIGDGTAAFYNYVYYTVAGFTEHDTFRSNQIRENQISRERALALIEDENQPRYQNIKWYLDTLGFDFEEVVKVVNNIPKLYKEKLY